MEYVGTAKGDSNDNCCVPDLITNSKADNSSPDGSENELQTQLPDPYLKPKDNAAGTSQEEPKERIDLKIIYNKQKIDVNFPLDSTVKDLKVHVQDIIAVPQAMQKVMIKGLAKDDQTLRGLGVTKGAKIMIVGSKLDDVLAVSIPTKQNLVDEVTAAANKELLSQQKMHRKVLDKGIPEDVIPGILESKESLPDFPLAGMLNKSGGKVRLTFKLEQDQLWIGTKERTDKIPMNSIKGVLSEPIHDHPEYHIMAIQLGPTEASRYWIYWVPAQFVSAIKDSILGQRIRLPGGMGILPHLVFESEFLTTIQSVISLKPVIHHRQLFQWLRAPRVVTWDFHAEIHAVYVLTEFLSTAHLIIC